MDISFWFHFKLAACGRVILNGVEEKDRSIQLFTNGLFDPLCCGQLMNNLNYTPSSIVIKKSGD
jgi:hypothetical protein